uniref:COesterase domain-containing protein n=1 Tax=Steinernema glaseri TaxID=37863 RepID=A0A1I7ZVU6_9BILA
MRFISRSKYIDVLLGLFHKAITISGSSFANFAINERVVKESQHLAEFLECEGSSQEILECLRNRSIDEFYVALVHISLLLCPRRCEHQKFKICSFLLGSIYSTTTLGTIVLQGKRRTAK